MILREKGLSVSTHVGTRKMVNEPPPHGVFSGPLQWSAALSSDSSAATLATSVGTGHARDLSGRRFSKQRRASVNAITAPYDKASHHVYKGNKPSSQRTQAAAVAYIAEDGKLYLFSASLFIL